MQWGVPIIISTIDSYRCIRIWSFVSFSLFICWKSSTSYPTNSSLRGRYSMNLFLWLQPEEEHSKQVGVLYDCLPSNNILLYDFYQTCQWIQYPRRIYSPEHFWNPHTSSPNGNIHTPPQHILMYFFQYLIWK